MTGTKKLPVNDSNPVSNEKRSMWSDLINCESIEWQKAKDSVKARPRVLVALSMGGFDHGLIVESVLSVALTLREASVDILLCDGLLPACQMMKISTISPEGLLSNKDALMCASCIKKGRDEFETLGLPVYTYSQLVNHDYRVKAEELAENLPWSEIENYQYEGLAVGEHAMAGALRYYARGDLGKELFKEKISRKFLQAALLTVFAMKELLGRNQYDVAVFHHGIYVPQGIIGEVCRKKGVRVVNWNPSYRKKTYIFSHGDSYHHTMISEPNSEWENKPWNEKYENKILEYLKDRWFNTRDWIWFHDNPVINTDMIAEELGIDFSKPCVGLLTSVVWDAQLHYRSKAFKNMMEWIVKTIDYFSRRPNLQLIIRVHPAEIRGQMPSRQRITDDLDKIVGKIPENVFIVPPESQTSTYALMEKCDSVIIYNTKSGIEVASMGIPVIVAGEAWIRGKGFSIDVASPEEYFKALDRLPLKEKLKPEILLRARQYAFHFFFCRMIDVRFIDMTGKNQPKFNVESLQSLMSFKKTAGLNIICDGILNGTHFVQDFQPG